MSAILVLREARGKKLDQMEGLLATAGDNLNDEQVKSFDDLKAEIGVLDGQIKRLEEVQVLKASQATPVARDEGARVFAEVKAPKEKGTDFARTVKALAASNGVARFAADFAEKTWGEDAAVVSKALGSATGSAGGFIVPPAMSGEMIELLRNRTVVRKAGAVSMELQNGSLPLPKLTGGSAAGYVGENQNIAKSEPTFGQIVMTSKTLACLVPVSNQLLVNSSPSADSVIRVDLLNGMAVTEDAAFLRGVGTGATPKGLRYWANSANVFASAGTSAANIETDLKGAIQKLEGNNVRMLSPGWIVSPRTKNALWVLRDANGNLVFPEIREGKLWGYPVHVTNQVPTNLGGGSDSEIYFVDFADAVIAEDQSIVISVSDQAAYHDGAQVVAAYSQDQTVIRAIMRHDFAVRHDFSVAVVTGVSY